MRQIRLVCGVLLIVLAARAQVSASPNGSIGYAQLQITGNRLTLVADDVDQILDVGERARVRTCYGGVEDPCGVVAPGDPRISGLTVHAELHGPELPQAVPVVTVPGGTFILPGFQQQGDYLLENIRLVNQDSGQVLGSAEPSTAVLRVVQIAITSATVERLSLEDLHARGITITQENYQAFDFAVGFAFGTETVTIGFPVLFEGNGRVEPLQPPSVDLDGLPSDLARVVERWQPPRLVPFKLEVPEDVVLSVIGEEPQILQFPLLGAIVLPGTVSYLNQFFDARLIVANGAPADSDVELGGLSASLRLPGTNALRLASTEPPVAPGQEVPVVGEGSTRIIPAGEQGAAAWTVEGLVAGTHALQMDITGEILRPGRDPLPVTSRAQAAVEVVDARFSLTFSHPDVVREDSEYTLFVTVANLSRAAQYDITVDLSEQHMTGAHPADAGDDMSRTIERLDPGQAETLEYGLVADVTGQVVASTYRSSSPAGEGHIELYTGVGELGIPLSPATLILPRFSERLAPPYPHVATDDLLRANVSMLGLAYSLAMAPAGLAPDGLPHVIQRDVERRAVDLAESGQRLFLDERQDVLESLEALALDQLGNRHHLAEYDELRRRTGKGLATASELAALLRREQEARGLDAVDLLDHLGTTMSYARPFIATTLVAGTVHPAPVLELRRSTIEGIGSLVYASDDDEHQPLRSLPFGEVYSVSRTWSSSTTVPLAVVGHVEPDETFQLLLHNQQGGDAEAYLVALVPDPDGGFRRVDYGTVVVPAHTVVGTDVGAEVASIGGFDLYNASTGLPLGRPSPWVTDVDLPPFRLLGAVQDYRMAESNRYGHGLSYLFNRPPDPEAAEDASLYRIVSNFTGIDVAGDPASGTAIKTGRVAFVQDSERVVNVRYSSPLSALVVADQEPLLEHEHQLDTGALVDELGNPLSTDVPEPRIETSPLHTGGLVDGRVLRGTGEGVAGALVELLRWRLIPTPSGFEAVLDLVADTETDTDGRFYFDFFEAPHPDPYVEPELVLRATVPEGDDPLAEPARCRRYRRSSGCKTVSPTSTSPCSVAARSPGACSMKAPESRSPAGR